MVLEHVTGTSQHGIVCGQDIENIGVYPNAGQPQPQETGNAGQNQENCRPSNPGELGHCCCFLRAARVMVHRLLSGRGTNKRMTISRVKTRLFLQKSIHGRK